MNVTLTPELEQFIHRQVEGGTYPSASEVIREGLRLLKDRDELRAREVEELRQEIAIGIEQADRGEIESFDEETLREIEAEGRNALAVDGNSRDRR